METEKYQQFLEKPKYLSNLVMLVYYCIYKGSVITKSKVNTVTGVFISGRLTSELMAVKQNQ